MIAAPGAFARVGLLLLLAVVLQLSVLARVEVVGAHLDVVVLVVAAVAFYAGGVTGCATGFAAGLLLDLAVGQAVGASSLVLTALGYAVGRYRELRDPGNTLTPIAVGALATLGWVAGFAVVSFMLDVGASVSPDVVRDALATVLLAALLSLPVFAACRRLLRPSLLVDPLEARRRRQRAPEPGPLGLRGLEI